MALLYEHAQSTGKQLDYLWLLDNLAMISAYTTLTGKPFTTLEPPENLTMSSLPVTIGDMILKSVFKSVDWDEVSLPDVCFYPECIELVDESFDLVSSADYLKSKLAGDLQGLLDELSFCIGYDLSLDSDDSCDDDVLNEHDDKDEDDDDDEMDYDDEENWPELLLRKFSDNCLTIHLYHSEQIADIVITLVKIKLILEEMKGELNEESHSNAA